MSGMSDVRLALHGQELEAGQERAVSTFCRWSLFRRRLHTRTALLDLTPEQLRDVGLTAEQARQEGLKPFWRG